MSGEAFSVLDPYMCYLVPATLAFFYFLFKLTRRDVTSGLKEPPCLPSLPFIGSLPFLLGIGGNIFQDLPRCLLDASKTRGDVFAIYAGQRYTLVLNGHATIHEALVTRAKDFAGKFGVYAEENIWNRERRGILSKQYGEEFKRNRLHTVAVLKQFGFGNSQIMMEKIHTSITHLHSFVRDKNGTTFNPTCIFNFSTLNVMNDLLFGDRFEVGDPGEVYIRRVIKEMTDSNIPLLQLFPLVSYIPAYRRWLNALHPKRDELNQFLRERIQASSERSDGENFIQRYVQQIGDEYDETELIYILRDFFVAGSESTSTQLCWAVILLGNNRDVLRRLQTELDAVVSRGRLPSMDDRGRLPLVEATLLEILRLRPIFPLMPRFVLRDTKLGGYSIPAGANVIVNIWSANMDSNMWNEPEKFQPERFLDENGEIKSRKTLCNFGLGTRSCPGEVLAMQELFLFLSAFVQQFDILPPEGQTKIREEVKRNDQFLKPAYFEVRLVSRE